MQRRPAGYLDSEAKWVLLQIGAERQYHGWVEALESQLGKPYDSIGIWDFATGSVYDLLDIGLGATVIASRG